MEAQDKPAIVFDNGKFFDYRSINVDENLENKIENEEHPQKSGDLKKDPNEPTEEAKKENIDNLGSKTGDFQWSAEESNQVLNKVNADLIEELSKDPVVDVQKTEDFQIKIEDTKEDIESIEENQLKFQEKFTFNEVQVTENLEDLDSDPKELNEAEKYVNGSDLLLTSTKPDLEQYYLASELQCLTSELNNLKSSYSSLMLTNQENEKTIQKLRKIIKE